jgi:putative endonuclease
MGSGRALPSLNDLRSRLSRLFAPRRKDTGRWGEDLAGDYLTGLGYRVLARNYRVRGGEADLICSKGELVVVVEVKTRLGKGFGAPQEAVDRRKARRVLKAGRAYCRRMGISLARLRADVVSVEGSPHEGKPRIRHFVSAIGVS